MPLGTRVFVPQALILGSVPVCNTVSAASKWPDCTAVRAEQQHYSADGWQLKRDLSSTSSLEHTE
jgi:hypothetical protein